MKRFVVFFKSAPEFSEEVTPIALFPNPTDDYFELKGGSVGLLELKIYDGPGRTYGSYSGDISKLNKYLGSFKLASGMYLLQIKDGDGQTQSVKAVKR